MKRQIKSFLLKYYNLPEVVKASFWFTVCGFFQQGINVITIPIFTRILTAYQFGQYNVYQSWMNIILIIATFGLIYGVINNGLTKYENDRNAFISSIQSLTTVITTICFIVYLLSFRFWNNIFGMSFVLVIAMFIQIYSIPSFYFWSAKQRYEFKYKGLVIITTLMSIMSALIGILAVILSTEKGIARIMAAVLVQLCFGLVFYVLNILKGKKLFIKEYWKFVLKFNLPLIPHYLSSIILNSSDRLMIKNFLGEDKAGIYSLAYSAAMILTVVMNGIDSTFTPWLYKKIKSGEYDEIKNVTNFILRGFSICIIGFIIFAPEIIRLLAPIEYQDAIWIIPPVACSVFFILLYHFFANIELYYEQTKFVMIASIIGAIFNIALNYLLIPMFGYIAAAYTTLICYIIYSLCHYIFMKQTINKFQIHKKIYNMSYIVIISLGLIISSTCITFIYNKRLIRMVIIILMLIISFMRRKRIISGMQVLKK